MYIIISSIIIVFLLFIIIYPLFKIKFKIADTIKFRKINDIEDLILKATVVMSSSNKVYMPFYEENDLYTELSKLKSKLKGNKEHQQYAYFNFPRAWLLLGLHKYGISKVNKEIEQTVINETEKLLTTAGKLKFKFDKLDQVLFGLLFLQLYKSTNDQKYLDATIEVYNKIQDFKTKEGLYLYRHKDYILFVDTLGMLLPFLYEYGNFVNSEKIIKEADNQLDYYISKTITVKNELPCHAYDLEKELKLGSNNWSRGIAWFMIGLGNASKFSLQKKYYQELYNCYWLRINELKEEKYWPQFFGHTNDYSIDSSATIMLLYSKYMIEEVRNEEIDLALKGSIDMKGFVVNNTGDTIYINKYSKIKGKSELSQGLLIWILSF